MQIDTRDALERYRTGSKISEAVGSSSFNRRLLQQGLVKEERGQIAPSGFGLILFGAEPRAAIPQAGLLATIHYPDGKEETRDFDGPMVLIPDQVEQWLRDKLPNLIDRSRMQRREMEALPFTLVREGVVNGLVHRDWDLAGAKCQLEVTLDTITIKSPGGPLPPVTLEQLQSFSAPTFSRNPVLHYVFARLDLAEERGLGMKTMKTIPEQLGLPLPKYVFEAPYLVLTLYRSPVSAIHALKPDILETLNDDDRATWQYLATKDIVNTPDVMRHLRFDEKKAQRVLKKLMTANLIRRVGKGPATHYEVVRP